MTQFQFDMICKIIEKGAPALADELCAAMDSFVKGYSALVEEHAQLKTQLADLTSKEANDEQSK